MQNWMRIIAAMLVACGLSFSMVGCGGNMEATETTGTENEQPEGHEAGMEELDEKPE